MTRARIIIFIVTIIVVGSFATLISLYARGWRLDRQTGKFSPNGLLVVKSYPDGAQVFINGELKTATNTAIPLLPSTYDVSIRKEGFSSWNKRLVIEEGVVTEVTAHLFRSAPSLSAITFAGVSDAVASNDLTKIAYVAPGKPSEEEEQDSAGLWIMETANLPIGFAREPRRITDGNLSDATWIWSPDGREILLTTKTGSFLLPVGEFTPQSQRVNITQRRNEILRQWQDEQESRLNAKFRRLPAELTDILIRKARAVVFSPDEDMLVYTASASASIAENLIKQLPGASTQKQEREIKEGRTYVYDIKEDRNFYITEGEVHLNGWTDYEKLIEIGNLRRSLAWYPSSRHLILAEDGKITIMDYDGTNRQTVYSGSYIVPYAYPALSLDRLLILTNLGGSDTRPNLYSLSLK